MFRAVLAVVFSVFLLAIVQGWHKSTGTTPDQAMWDVGLVGLGALLYSSVNGFNALRHSLSQEARTVYVGFLFSLLPLLVAVYSIAVWQYSPSKLTTFQIICMLFGGLSAALDLSLFTWLTFGSIRGGQERRRG